MPTASKTTTAKIKKSHASKQVPAQSAAPAQPKPQSSYFTCISMGWVI